MTTDNMPPRLTTEELRAQTRTSLSFIDVAERIQSTVRAQFEPVIAGLENVAKINTTRFDRLHELMSERDQFRAELALTIEARDSWMDAATQARERGDDAAAERDAARAEAERLREALKRIAAIEDDVNSGDWKEINEARDITTAALAPQQ